MAGVFPVNRVHDILRRMDNNNSQSEAMKTCFGILAIMAREDSNKTIIAKDGMEIILNAMTAHVDKTDVQESGCDLLWSLAFNNAPVKEIIAKYGGASVVVRGLKRHSRAAEFLKSACGAMSNMCQSKLNQEGVSAQGGLQPLVVSIHAHQSNSKLLPFIFDALASLIVSNEENARTVSSLGLIPLVVSSLGRHKQSMEVVKSGCHTLAILSDVKGQASKIAFAGGVPIILSLLDLHSSYADLHRVAAVVLLRMLQESAHVGREITCNEGVRILLKSLDKGGAQQDTVAAVTHILFTVTNPTSPAASAIEPQLWIQVTNSERKVQSSSNSISITGMNKQVPSNLPQVFSNSDSSSSGITSQSALGGLVTIMKQYAERRDVVRAGCRLIHNLGGFSGVVDALDKFNILEVIFDCVSIHHESKDVIETAATLLKTIYRRHVPTIQGDKSVSFAGLLHVFRSKINDEEIVGACADIISNYRMSNIFREKSKEKDNLKDKGSKEDLWEYTATTLLIRSLEKFISNEKEDTDSKSENGKSPVRRALWTKNSQRVITSLLNLTESLCGGQLAKDTIMQDQLFKILQNVSEVLPLKSADLSKRINQLLPVLNTDQSKQINCVEESVNSERLNKDIVSTNSRIAKTDQNEIVKDNNENFSNKNIQNRKNNEIHHDSSHENDSKKSSQSSAKTVEVSVKPQRLLECWPNFLERLNNPSSMNRSFNNNLMQADRMHICYEGATAAGKGIKSKVDTPVPYVCPINGIGDSFEHSLTFDSEFESGNLMKAIQRGDANYDLFLRGDVHTPGHTQWFYFAVSHTHPQALVRLAEQGVQVPPVRVRFNICNLTKPDSLFNLGMRPCVYSFQDASSRGAGWVRSGCDISYYCNNYSRNNTAGEGINNYYTLSFTIEFHNVKDSVRIAYSYPYTMSDYRAHINSIIAKPGSRDIIKQSKLCSTLNGDDCDLLVITNFKEKDKEKIGATSVNQVEMREDVMLSIKKPSFKTTSNSKLKPALFFSCRVHPGETPASWMMKGMLDFLTSDSSQAQLLRQVFVIYIVPMLNPDGVTFGNNRCSLAGVDLNRQWKLPIKGVHPTIYNLKTFMATQRKVRDVLMYIDLHGHSRKYNVFMYGCDDKKRKSPQVRAFPRFFSMHSIGQKYVSYSDCSFHVKKGRESTARVVVAKEINIPCSFTLEATFCGANYGPLKHCHMNMGHLQEVGAALSDAVLNFAISEGRVKECATVPMNLRAVQQVENAIAAEDGTVSIRRPSIEIDGNSSFMNNGSFMSNDYRIKNSNSYDNVSTLNAKDHSSSNLNKSTDKFPRPKSTDDIVNVDIDSDSDQDGNDALSDSDSVEIYSKKNNQRRGINDIIQGKESTSKKGKRSLSNTMPSLPISKTNNGSITTSSSIVSQGLLPMPPNSGTPLGQLRNPPGLLSSSLRTLTEGERKTQDDIYINGDQNSNSGILTNSSERRTVKGSLNSVKGKCNSARMGNLVRFLYFYNINNIILVILNFNYYVLERFR
jgi:hypothetical protein